VASKIKGQGKSSAVATQVELHDREQLEIRFNYAMGANPGQHEYRMDAYLFVPRNVGLNRGNYTRAEFYADVTPYMRLDAEAVPLEQLADGTRPPSPLHRLWEAVGRFRGGGHPPPSQPLVVPVKLYAYLFAEAIKDEVRGLRRRIQRHQPGSAESAEELLASVSGVLDRARTALWAYRRLRTAFWAFEPICHTALVDALRNADEYMSLFLEERLALLVRSTDKATQLYDGSAVATRLRLLVAALAAEEAQHRLKYGFLRLTSTEPRDGEYFTYYTSHLKKSVHNALYLETRAIEADDVYLRNAVAAFGAALAAIWAFATRLPDTLAGMSASAQLAVVAGVVLAYVMKDRIKAFTNEYLTQRLRKFDHKSWLHGPSMAVLGLDMVRIRAREAMRFLKTGETPAQVLSTRMARRTVRRAEAYGEEVIHYRKLITMEVDDERPVPPGYRLRDIVRLNVRHFLVRLDEPLANQPYFDIRQGAFAEAALPKVYHLNLILKVSRIGPAGPVEEQLEHLKVVLDKQRIVRVERVDTLGSKKVAGRWVSAAAAA
jgi:hypothetical protein